MVDSGLLSGILRVGIDDALGDSDLLGRMVETFVVAQLSAQAAIAETRYRLSRLREQDGRREVDVIAELAGGRIIGIEVKVKAAVARSDARRLMWLRDEMSDRFTAGLVLHSGRDVFELDERIFAAPISTLWASPEGRHSSSGTTGRGAPSPRLRSPVGQERAARRVRVSPPLSV